MVQEYEQRAPYQRDTWGLIHANGGNETRRERADSVYTPRLLAASMLHPSKAVSRRVQHRRIVELTMQSPFVHAVQADGIQPAVTSQGSKYQGPGISASAANSVKAEVYIQSNRGQLRA